MVPSPGNPNILTSDFSLDRQAGAWLELHRSMAQCNLPCKAFWFDFTFVRSFPASSMNIDSMLPQSVPQLATPHALL